uniref:Uncharacterized protein n=1 Tax=Sphenodon punctatus TaxID=8508 RepID=A0A8D0HML6_SPHPU
MPCRRPGGERFLVLERAVSLQGPSGEVDALVAKLGEVLQLAPAPRTSKYPGRDRAAPYSPRGLLAPPDPQRPDKSSQRGAKQLCGRGWLRSAARRRKRQPAPPGLGEGPDPEEDDPHRLLQQLILSGNLIKEAVRRLHRTRILSPPFPSPPPFSTPNPACSQRRQKAPNNNNIKK